MAPALAGATWKARPEKSGEATCQRSALTGLRPLGREVLGLFSPLGPRCPAATVARQPRGKTVSIVTSFSPKGSATQEPNAETLRPFASSHWPGLRLTGRAVVRPCYARTFPAIVRCGSTQPRLPLQVARGTSTRSLGVRLGSHSHCVFPDCCALVAVGSPDDSGPRSLNLIHPQRVISYPPSRLTPRVSEPAEECCCLRLSATVAGRLRSGCSACSIGLLVPVDPAGPYACQPAERTRTDQQE